MKPNRSSVEIATRLPLFHKVSDKKTVSLRQDLGRDTTQLESSLGHLHGCSHQPNGHEASCRDRKKDHSLSSDFEARTKRSSSIGL